MADEELVKKFVDLHAQAEQLLSKDQVRDAKQKYLDVVETYHAIEKSTLEHFHKELAYDQVTTLFKKVSEAKERVAIPYHIIAAAALIMALSILIFLKPSVVGLAGFEDTIRQPVDFKFTETKIQQATLRDRPLTLSASGTYTGKVKLFYKTGEKFELIFDSEKATDGTFIDICVDTCEITANSNVIELFAQIETGGSLTVTGLSYKVERKSNTAPTWKATTRSFKANVNKPLSIDLNEYFTDLENDQLVYLSTTAEGLEVTVQNSQVTITPKTPGKKDIVFVASDLIEVTRIPVNIEVS